MKSLRKFYVMRAAARQRHYRETRPYRQNQARIFLCQSARPIASETGMDSISP